MVKFHLPGGHNPKKKNNKNNEDDDELTHKHQQQQRPGLAGEPLRKQEAFYGSEAMNATEEVKYKPSPPPSPSNKNNNNNKGNSSKEKESRSSSNIIEEEDLELLFNINESNTRTVPILIEVVSAWNIRAGDIGGKSDPYVNVLYKGKRIWKTSYINSTLSPVWTIKSKSLTVFAANIDDLKSEGGLEFHVHDYDAVGSHDLLGAAKVPAEDILADDGNVRREYKLFPKGQFAAIKDNITDKVPVASQIVKVGTLVGKGAAKGIQTGIQTIGLKKKKEKDINCGYIALRFRNASDEDINFVKELYAKKKNADVLKDNVLDTLQISGIGKKGKVDGTKPKIKAPKLFQRNHKKVDGEKVNRVLPNPDPDDPERTKWMTEKAIEEEAYKPSKKWIDAGTGDYAKIYLEIIGCDGLPNLDVGMGDKTDAFFNIIFEDIEVKTDVIHDCLSPRFMPWTQRAFIFRMMHPVSSFYIACFDYDKVGGHDYVGRVVIRPSSFVRNTEYILKYNLYESNVIPQKTNSSDPKSPESSDRKPRGTVTLRMRIERPSELQTLIAGIFFPERMYINTETKSDFQTAYLTSHGLVNAHEYNFDVLMTYLDELMQVLKGVFIVCIFSFIDTLLWRGSKTIKIPCFVRPATDNHLGASSRSQTLNELTPLNPTEKSVEYKRIKIWFPVHSLTAFLWGITLVETPSLIFSFFFFSIFWCLCWTYNVRSISPNPWARCRNIWDLILGIVQDRTQCVEIDPNDNREEIEEFNEAVTARKKFVTEKINEVVEEWDESNQQYQKDLEEIGEYDVDITTSTKKKVSLDFYKKLSPLAKVLWPIQVLVGKICVIVRSVKNVILWENPYMSVIVLLAGLILSMVNFFFPWAFLLHWTFRILVWTLLGPWMKLVDIFIVKKFKNMTPEERRIKREKAKGIQRSFTQENARYARTIREDMVKIRDIKKHYFGKYIVQVMGLGNYRFKDEPIITASSAKPFTAEMEKQAKANMCNVKRVKGQHLVGNMIPRLHPDD